MTEQHLSSTSVEAAVNQLEEDRAEFDARYAGESAAAINLDDALASCERTMRKLRSLEQAKARIDADHKAQLAEIEQWHKQEDGRLLGEMHRLRMLMEPLVRALVAADPMGRRSVELVCGRAGFRKSSGRLVVDDEAAAIDWLDVHLDGDYVRTKRTVDVARMKECITAGVLSLDEVPGVRLEPGGYSFWTEPIG